MSNTRNILKQVTDAEQMELDHAEGSAIVHLCEAIRLIVDTLEDLEGQIQNVHIILSDQ
jgi:flagellar biosynthesis/type III secretory pathway chaperone